MRFLTYVNLIDDYDSDDYDSDDSGNGASLHLIQKQHKTNECEFWVSSLYRPSGAAFITYVVGVQCSST